MSATEPQTDSPYAAARLLLTLLIMTLGASGMYVVPVVLPAVQSEFGVTRAGASLPYALLMIGFGAGGLVMGRLADRFGVVVPLLIGSVSLGTGFVIAGNASDIGTFNAVHALFIGFAGSSATFSALRADTSMWWVRRRGIAVAVCASGNYLGGAIWPPLVQHFVEAAGWRATYTGMGLVIAGGMAACAFAMRGPPPALAPESHEDVANRADARPFGLSPATAQ